MNILHFWETINNHFVDWIMRILRSDCEEEVIRQRIRYTLMVICNEFEKFFLLCIVFLLTGYFFEYLVACTAIISIRMFSGGSHRKTNLGCFIQSLCTFSVAIGLGRVIDITKLFSIIVYICLIGMIWYWNLIESPNRIAYTVAQQYKFKGKALTILLIYKMLEPYIPQTYYNVIFWSWVLLIVEVTIVHIELKWKEEKKDGIDEICQRTAQ